MKHLVICEGFIGDVLFASSIAERLVAIDPDAIVDYAIPLVQPKLLLERNPYINAVFVFDRTLDTQSYDKVHKLPAINQSFPATIQYQEFCGITDTKLPYKVYGRTPRSSTRDNTLHIGIVEGWKERAYQSTPYALHYGIGQPHRDIDMVIDYIKNIKLDRGITITPIGLSPNINSKMSVAQNVELFDGLVNFIDTLLDIVIGPEGGLTNLAAGLGVPTIITTDFIWQNYGPSGRVSIHAYPQMGPSVYFGVDKHYALLPTIKDEDIGPQIERILTERYS